MSAVVRATQMFRNRIRLVGKPLPEPEPVFASTPRQMVGLFALLSDDQKRQALSYDGDENHGDSAFKLKQA